MHRVLIVVVALLTVGCSSHSSLPSPANVDGIAPQVIQRPPCCASSNGDVWVHLTLPSYHGYNVYPTRILSDGKSRIWFIDNFCQVGYITMDQKILIYTLKIACDPNTIALGPDGNIWLSGNSGVVARLTPTGIESDFTTKFVRIVSMTAGPDGAIWFGGCRNICYIGRMKTDGTYRTYSFGAHGYPSALISGPDGNLWIADYNYSVHKFSTNGVNTVYTVPGHPINIIVGPDGALYFEENNDDLNEPNYLGRVTTSGSVTIISQPNGYSVNYIVNGPGHLIWAMVEPYIMETYNPATGTFGPTIKAPSNGDNSAVDDLVDGPDHNIWAILLFSRILTYVHESMMVSPSRISVERPGASDRVVVSETNFRGQWAASTSARKVATVEQSSRGLFTVTGVAAGSCKVTISDGNGNSVVVPVTVQ